MGPRTVFGIDARAGRQILPRFADLGLAYSLLGLPGVKKALILLAWWHLVLLELKI